MEFRALLQATFAELKSDQNVISANGKATVSEQGELSFEGTSAVAVRDVTVQSNNPVLGLNALGGAVTLSMKDGLTFDGAQAELSGGSFGNVSGNGQLGRRFGDVGLYLGAGAQHDDGFRYHSPATLRQASG